MVESFLQVNDWINGWNESSAEDACNTYFNESILFGACSSLSNVNSSSSITNCILNIQVYTLLLQKRTHVVCSMLDCYIPYCCSLFKLVIYLDLKFTLNRFPYHPLSIIKTVYWVIHVPHIHLHDYFFVPLFKHCSLEVWQQLSTQSILLIIFSKPITINDVICYIQSNMFIIFTNHFLSRTV